VDPAGQGRGRLPWLTSPVLGKTAATILDEQRLSTREIADVLGHSRPSLTQDVSMHRGAANPAAGAALNEALRPRTA
jgi:integrase